MKKINPPTSSIFDTIIKYSFLVLFFITPFLVSVKSSELFEFPKMLFVYTITVIITSSWLAKIATQGIITWKRSWLDPILLFFLATQLISTILSMHPYTSWFGYYTRVHGGMFSTICYAVLAWGFVNFATREWVKNILIAQLAAASLISLYAIGEHFGIDAHIWVQDVRNRVFSTLGQPNWLAAWLGALIPFTLYYYYRPPKSHWPTIITLNLLSITISYLITYSLTNNPLPLSGKPLLIFSLFFISLLSLIILKTKALYQKFQFLNSYSFLILTTIFTITILYTKSRSGILALVASTLVFFTANFLEKKSLQFKKTALILSTILIPLFVIGTEWTPSLNQILTKTQNQVKNPLAQTSNSNTLPQAETVSDSTDIRQSVWKGAISIAQKNLFFGSGTETFAYAYYQNRPVEHNRLSEWDFLYNKAHNEYLNYLANNGILGLTAVFSIIVSVLWITLKPNFKSWLKLTSGIIIISLLFSLARPTLSQKIVEKLLIYPPSVIPLAIAFLLALLLTILIQRKYKTQQDLKTKNPALIASLISIFITNFYGFSVVNIALIFFTLPAIIVIEQESYQLMEKAIFQRSSINTISKFIAAAFLIFFLININNQFSSDAWYTKSKAYLDQGYIVESIKAIDQALLKNPDEATFYQQKALASAQAVYVLSQKDASDSTGLIETLTQQAEQANKITLLKNPVHLNLYKSAVKVYLTLGFIDNNYFQEAINTLEIAKKLSPTDPQLPLNLALLHQQLGHPIEAESYYKETVTLKPNYRRAWILFAQLYQTDKNYEKATEIYNYILKNIDPNDQTSLENLKVIQAAKNQS
jgi:putative inorganic carbon (HCO3(-)) transporter